MVMICFNDISSYMVPTFLYNQGQRGLFMQILTIYFPLTLEYVKLPEQNTLFFIINLSTHVDLKVSSVLPIFDKKSFIAVSYFW